MANNKASNSDKNKYTDCTNSTNSGSSANSANSTNSSNASNSSDCSGSYSDKDCQGGKNKKNK